MSSVTAGLNDLSAIDLSLVLSVVDHLLQYDEDGTSYWLISNNFEKDFFIASYDRIVSAFKKLGMEILDIEKKKVKVKVLSEGRILRRDEVQSIVKDIEHLFANPRLVDYCSLVPALVEGIKQVIIKRRPNLAALEKVVALSIIPFEPSIGLEADEVGFGVGGMYIQFPNPVLFTDAHKAIWSTVPSKPNRIYRDYLFQCLLDPCHEFVHTMQNICWPQSGSVNLWKLEYWASHPALNVLAIVSNARPDLYPPGLKEEMMLYEYETVERIHKEKVTPELLQRYKEWKVTFGQKPPMDDNATDAANERKAETRYVKFRLSFEAYDGGSSFDDLCDFYFNPELPADESFFPDFLIPKKELF